MVALTEDTRIQEVDILAEQVTRPLGVTEADIPQLRPWDGQVGVSQNHPWVGPGGRVRQLLLGNGSSIILALVTSVLLAEEAAEADTAEAVTAEEAVGTEAVGTPGMRVAQSLSISARRQEVTRPLVIRDIRDIRDIQDILVTQDTIRRITDIFRPVTVITTAGAAGAGAAVGGTAIGGRTTTA